MQCLRISFYDPIYVHEVNTTGTLNVCLAAHRCRVDRLINCSSSEALGSAVSVPMKEDHPYVPTTPYGASKAAGELYVHSYANTHKIKVMTVRPFNTYGPREHLKGPHGEVIPKFFVRALAGKNLIIFGNGLQTRDFNYVTDTAEGLYLASCEDKLIGDKIQIASGVETSIKDLASIILEIVNRPESKIEFLDERPGDVMRHWADISKAREMLGYKPNFDIRSGLKKYFQWIKDSGLDPEESLRDEQLINWETKDSH